MASGRSPASSSATAASSAITSGSQARTNTNPEGRYYLEWYELGRRRRKAVESFDLVLPSARAKSIELEAIKAGVMVQPELSAPVEPVRLTMDEAIDQYLAFIRKHRSLRTFRTYRPVLKVHFRASYMKTYVDEVDRSDMLKFVSDLIDFGLAERTIYDRLVVVLQLFKRHGHKGLVERGDFPNYVETIRPTYEPEEIMAMLGEADPDEAILIKFALATGFRDREIRYVTWRDIDFRNHVARVTKKPVWGFKPKNYEERSVPVPAALIEQLQKLKESRNAALSDLVFPNTKGKPNSLHIEIVKEVAYRMRFRISKLTTAVILTVGDLVALGFDIKLWILWQDLTLGRLFVLVSTGLMASTLANVYFHAWREIRCPGVRSSVTESLSRDSLSSRWHGERDV